MLTQRAWRSLFCREFDVRRDLESRRKAKIAAGVPVERVKKPGRRSLAEERAEFEALQRGSVLIPKENRVIATVSEVIEHPKVWVPSSPRYFRSERPGANVPDPAKRASAAEQFDALWTPPEEVVRIKVETGIRALAEHFNGGK